MTPAEIRNSRRWRRLSEQMRRRYPLCFNPLKLHSYKPADEVHHIIPIANLLNLKDRPYVFDTRNLVCLCYRCHRKIDAMNRKGIDTKQLFADRLGGCKNLYSKQTYIKTIAAIGDISINFRGGGCKPPCKKLLNGYFCGMMNKNRDIPCGNCELNQWLR